MARPPAGGGKFAAQCAAFAEKAQKRIVYARNKATLMTAEEILSNLSMGAPNVVTGFLRASLMASTSFMPLFRDDGDQPEEGQSYSPDISALEAQIMAARMDEVPWLYFTAAYARRLEHGFVGTDSLGRTYNQSGYGFVARALQMRGRFVHEAAKEARRAIP